MTEKQNKVVAILQPNYIPWKGYFDMIRTADELILLDDVQYTHDWRNRNRIKTRDGIKWITIPVHVKSLQSRINEVTIAGNGWKRKHLNSFVHNYARTKWFGENYDWLKSLLLDHDDNSLNVINYRFIKAIAAKLGIHTPISFSSDYNVNGTKAQKVLNLCRHSQATVYLSGPSAKVYLDEELFNRAGISVSWMDYIGYPEYRQLFPPFDHHVSILDLILNEGPEAPEYMKTFMTV